MMPRPTAINGSSTISPRIAHGLALLLVSLLSTWLSVFPWRLDSAFELSLADGGLLPG
jgi:hypothetical protein